MAEKRDLPPLEAGRQEGDDAAKISDQPLPTGVYQVDIGNLGDILKALKGIGTTMTELERKSLYASLRVSAVDIILGDIKSATQQIGGYMQMLTPSIATGAKVLRGVAKGGRTKAEKSSRAMQERYAHWQKAAEEIWSRDPSKSVHNVATLLAARFKVSRHTIRKVIRKRQ